MQELEPELRLLGLVCARGIRSQATGELIPPPTVVEPIDWTHFLKLVRQHGVVVLAYIGLQNMPIPPQLLEKLRNLKRMQQMGMMHLTGELLRVVSAFDAHNIMAISLKGPLLAQQLYNAVGIRMSTDLDLVVSTENLEAAQATLISLGYELVYFKQPLTARQLKRLQSAMAIHLNFRHPEKQVVIELHWRLFIDRHLLPAATHTDVLRHPQLAKLSGRELFALQDDARLLYLCLHGANHIWARMKWLSDVAALIVINQIDWESWCHWVKELTLERPVAQALQLVRDVFEIPLPAACNALVNAEQSTSYLVGQVYNVWAPGDTLGDRLGGGFELLYRMRLQPNWRHWMLTPSRIWMRALCWPWWNIPDWLWPINYVCAPFVWLFRTILGREITKR